MLLLGGLLALVFAAFGWAPAAAIAIVLGTAAGLIVWARRPFFEKLAAAPPARVITSR